MLSLFYIVPRFSKNLWDGLELSTGGRGAVLITYRAEFAYWFTGFCALMADNLVGSALYQYYAVSIGFDVATLAGIYSAIMFVYPVERGLASIVLAVIAIATSRGLAMAHLSLPLVGRRAEEQRELLSAE
jgi:hypothetical protein